MFTPIQMSGADDVTMEFKEQRNKIREIIEARDDPDAVKTIVDKDTDCDIAIGAAVCAGRHKTLDMLLSLPGYQFPPDLSALLYRALEFIVEIRKTGLEKNFKDTINDFNLGLDLDSLDEHARAQLRRIVENKFKHKIDDIFKCIELLLKDDRIPNLRFPDPFINIFAKHDGQWLWQVADAPDSVLILFKKKRTKLFRKSQLKRLWEKKFELFPGMVEVRIAPFLLPKIPGPVITEVAEE